MTLALVAAVGGAVAYGAGSLLQSIGARRAAAGRHGVLGVAREVPYLAGLGLDLVAWLLSLLALRRLPLFAVQSILGGSLAVTVVFAAITGGPALRRLDAAVIGGTVLALVVLGAAAGAERPSRVGRSLELALLFGVPLVAAVAAAVARWATPVVTGATSGLAFGCAALAARAVHSKTSLTGTLTEPLALAVAAYGVIGMLDYAHALEHGDVGPVTASLWVAEIVVPGIIGVTVLGDQVRRGWALPALLATGFAVAATIALSASAARAITSSKAESEELEGG